MILKSTKKIIEVMSLPQLWNNNNLYHHSIGLSAILLEFWIIENG